MDINKTGWNGTNPINMEQGRDQWQTPVNKNLLDSIKSRRSKGYLNNH